MNNPICSCVFIKKSETGFAIIVVYVDYLNLMETLEVLIETAKYLKKKFEMKDIRKQNVVLASRSIIFQVECWFINQHILRKILKHFNMDKAHPLSFSMVV